MSLPHPIRRTVSFLRDFMPESGLQLLFPMASFILFIGASTPWLPPGHVLLQPRLQGAERKLGMANLWFDLSTVGAALRYYGALWITDCASVASVALWCLPFRSVARKFATWVFFPVGLAVFWFLFLVSIAPVSPHSILEPESQLFLDHLRAFPVRFAALGIGFYITLIGAASLALCLWAFRRGNVSLPLRFRRPVANSESAVNLGFGKRVFALIAVGIFASIILSVFETSAAIGLSRPAMRLIGMWPRNFPLLTWAPALATAITCSVCAVLLFENEPRETLAPNAHRPPLGISIPAAAAVALLIICLPRIAFAISAGSPIFSVEFDYGSSVPAALFGMDVPQPFFWLLLVYPIVLLQEFVLRKHLQSALQRRFGVKRAILLVAFLWWMLPLGFGIGPTFHSRGVWPVVPTLIFISVCGIFSAALGWFYARTNSILPGTAFCGTIVFFHEGSNFAAYFQHPSLYWIELVLITLFSLFVFSGIGFFQRLRPLAQRKLTPS